MTEDDKFFERLRADARPLRYQADEVTLARIRARIVARLEKPSVLELIARWFRPLAASAAALALAAAIGIVTMNRTSSQELTLTDNVVEITVAGETYRVGY